MIRKDVTCPQCGRPITNNKNNPWRPFCSNRCRLVDLGAWLNGSRRIPTAEPVDMDEWESNGSEPTQH